MTLVLPDGWLDITDELPKGAPPTLAKANGIGALQFSAARYRAGPRPRIQIEDLRSLLEELSDEHALGRPTGVKERTGEVFFVSGDFSQESEFIRAWYVSNGSDVVLASYTTQEPHDTRFRAEVSESERIVASIDFS